MAFKKSCVRLNYVNDLCQTVIMFRHPEKVTRAHVSHQRSDHRGEAQKCRTFGNVPQSGSFNRAHDQSSTLMFADKSAPIAMNRPLPGKPRIESGNPYATHALFGKFALYPLNIWQSGKE